MANYWPGFWSDLDGAIAAAYPTIGGTFRATQAERINWVNLISDLTLATPYAVVQITAEQDEDYSSGDSLAYRIHADVTIIDKMTGTDAGAGIEAGMKTLQDNLIGAAAVFTHMQVLQTGWKLDVSESNVVNESMLQANMPFSAGTLAFDCIVGEYAL